MTNRGRGDYLERQTRAALRHYGWIVIRAAGSLGVADIVALRAGNTPLLVSCKLGGLPPPHERVELLEAAERAGARAIVGTREHPGWVTLYSMRSTAPRDYLVAGELKVPQRPGKEVADPCPHTANGGLGSSSPTHARPAVSDPTNGV